MFRFIFVFVPLIMFIVFLAGASIAVRNRVIRRDRDKDVARRQERPPAAPETVFSYASWFQDAYYRSQEKGRELDPWDLPPEQPHWARSAQKPPWEL